MNIENLIKDTFAAREHGAPDSDAVLAAARQRIDSRRSGLSRPFAVAAGATVLTLGAVTAVVLSRPGPAEHSQIAAPANGSQSSQTPTTGAPARSPTWCTGSTSDSARTSRTCRCTAVSTC